MNGGKMNVELGLDSNSMVIEIASIDGKLTILPRRITDEEIIFQIFVPYTGGIICQKVADA